MCQVCMYFSIKAVRIVKRQVIDMIYLVDNHVSSIERRTIPEALCP